MSAKQNESKNEYEDQIRGHNFDGIQEYDNPMPGWWVFTFWITVVFSVVYVGAISYGWIPSYEDDLASGQAEIKNLQRAAEAMKPKVVMTDEVLLAAAKDDKDLAAGKEVYTAKCAPCHGPEGQGLIGPNLTDNAWKNGGKPTEIYDVVENGRASKGMPAWGPAVGDDGVRQLVAYIISIKGTNPANPKAPEGDVVE